MTAPSLDVRADFPFLSRLIHGKPVIYFDNAATAQKPASVIESVAGVYSSGVSNVHRAVNFLAEEVTGAFENSRQTVAAFIGAHAQEIIFIPNATYGINLVCSTLGPAPPRVLTTTLEHHSNLLPWLRRGEVDYIPWSSDGTLDLDGLARKLRDRPDLVAVAHASNFLGVIHPIEEIISLCHRHGVPVLVDASQSIAHQSIDVRRLNCEYLVFSGHKVYGPGGSGALYVRRDVLEGVSPWLVGGSMVKEVHSRGFVENDLPYRLEAGTPNIEGAIGLAAALEYLSGIGYEHIAAHENALHAHARRRLKGIRSLKLFGPEAGAPLIAFQLPGLDPGAVAKTLGARANIIVRSGFHCAQPAHEELGIGPTVRASFAIYNTLEEIDTMAEVLTALSGFLH